MAALTLVGVSNPRFRRIAGHIEVSLETQEALLAGIHQSI